jgi:hypothetical protein
MVRFVELAAHPSREGMEKRRRRLLHALWPLGLDLCAHGLGTERDFFEVFPGACGVGFSAFDDFGNSAVNLFFGQVLPARERLEDHALARGELMSVERLVAMPSVVFLGAIEPGPFVGPTGEECAGTIR